MLITGMTITMRYCHSHRGAAGLRSLQSSPRRWSSPVVIATPLVPSAAPPFPSLPPSGGKESFKDNGKDSGGNRSQGGAQGSLGNGGGQTEGAGASGAGNNLLMLELLDVPYAE